VEKKFPWVAGGILLLLALAAGFVLVSRRDGYLGLRYEPPVPAYDFFLTGGDGGQVHLGDFRGRVVLLFFGYTSCPDICPTTLAELSLLADELDRLALSVQVLYVTVDPQRDLPDKIATYARAFDPSFIGLTGSEEMLTPVWQSYGVYRSIDTESPTALGYLVSHSTRLYLIDPQGNLFLSYTYGTPREDILHDIRLLLRELPE